MQTLLWTLTQIVWGLIGLYSLGLVIYLVLRLAFGGAFWWLALANTFALLLFLPLLVTVPVVCVLWFARATSPIVMNTILILQAGLMVVAILWFVPPMFPKNAVRAVDGLVLKVVTFNILGERNPNYAGTVSWLEASGADLIALQEMPGNVHSPRLERLYGRYPYEAVIEGSIRILSRYPILEETPVFIESYPPGRLMLRVVTAWEQQTIAVYALHLTLPEGDKRHLSLPLTIFPFSMMLNYDETRRNAQIEQLLAYLESETLPYIVVGDFNMSEYSVMYDSLAARMADSYREVGAGTGKTWPVSRNTAFPDFVPPLLRIDYIWHSRDFSAVDFGLGPPLGSDHLPVMGELVLRTNPR